MEGGRVVLWCASSADEGGGLSISFAMCACCCALYPGPSFLPVEASTYLCRGSHNLERLQGEGIDVVRVELVILAGRCSRGRSRVSEQLSLRCVQGDKGRGVDALDAL